LYLPAEVDFAATADLPNAGDAWFDREAAAVSHGVFGDFSWHGWSWADQGHITNQHVVQLRQLVHRKLSEPFADPGNPGIILDFESHALFVGVVCQQVLQPFFGIQAHRTDFEHLEFTPELADSSLSEEDWAAVFYFDQNGNQQKQRAQKSESDSAYQDIKSPFSAIRAGGKPRGAQSLMKHMGA